MKNKVDEHALFKMLTRRAFFKQGGLCYHCQLPIQLSQITGDHLIPRYQGGLTKAGNIVAACYDCNNKRNPETNRQGGRLNMTVGDDTPRSPFEVLRGGKK